MTPTHPPPEAPTPQANELRQRAEQRALEAGAVTTAHHAALASDATAQVLHELQVHQIELEMQNEELRQSEARLAASRARYFDLYDLAPVGYITVNETWLILEANLTASTLLNVARCGLLKQPLVRFVLRDDLVILAQHRQQLFASDTPQTFELRMAHPQKSPCWMQLTASRAQDEEGQPICHVALSDITERKQIEQSLRIKNYVFDSSITANSVANLDGLLTEANDAFVRIWGYSSKDEILGKHVSLFLNDLHAADAIIAALRKTGRWEGDYIARRKDDSSFIAHGMATVVRDERGEVVGFQSVVEDITARKQAEAQLLATNHQLEEATVRTGQLAAQAEMANAAKSEFLANISHEIRTPMNGVIGMNGLLLDTDLDPEQRHYAETVRASGEAMLTLINSILDFSKIEAHKLDLEELDFELPNLLDDFAATLAVQAHDKGLALRCSADPDVPVLLRGDPGRLRQILINLGGNAVKFTHIGEVCIHVSLVEMSAEEVLLRFAVRDTGIGIAADKLDLLFNKFSQVDVSTTRCYGGSGLGLAISKELAELMGGAIGLTSEEGKGSQFWFTARLGKPAPVALPPPPATAPRSASELLCQLGGRKARILVAEDNITNQQVTLGLLKKIDLRADAVANGAEALKALSILPYDLVLMDVQMPVMDGIEATRQVRQLEAASGKDPLPIIAMTAYAMRGDRERFLAAGMNDYVAKPVSLHALAETLSHWLPPEAASADQPALSVSAEPVVEATAQPAAPPLIFDKDGFMARMLEDEELARRIIACFLTDLPRQIAALRDALQSGDAAGTARAAHTIKGAAANVSGEELHEEAAAIEQAARADNLAAAALRLADLETRFGRLREIMSCILKSHFEPEE